VASNTVHLQWITSAFAIFMALLVIFIRLQASKKPTSVKKIIIPPLGMSTGFLMFLAPQTHIPWSYAGIACLVGLLFSIPLIATSKFEYLDGQIYLKRSKGFPLILLTLLALRIGLHQYVEEFISLPQTGAVFFILAFSMILPWRIMMLKRYRDLRMTIPNLKQAE
jgi:membrane protein CcdC involved in cytochrome C biogenesis